MHNHRQVLDQHGYVELEAQHGCDLDIVNAARVSFAKRSSEYGDSEAGILRFLMKERHGSPFEHNYFRFRVRAPIVVFWEWVRHRTASYNVQSGRYTRMEPLFYLPGQARTQVGSPGKYTFEALETNDQTQWMQSTLKGWCEEGFDLYLEAIERGIAPEQARLFIPMNFYIEFLFSCNARGLMNFLALRNHPQAMMEIRSYAEAIEELFGQVMPDTAHAFQTNGRVTP